MLKAVCKHDKNRDWVELLIFSSYYGYYEKYSELLGTSSIQYRQRPEDNFAQANFRHATSLPQKAIWKRHDMKMIVKFHTQWIITGTAKHPKWHASDEEMIENYIRHFLYCYAKREARQWAMQKQAREFILSLRDTNTRKAAAVRYHTHAPSRKKRR